MRDLQGLQGLCSKKENKGQHSKVRQRKLDSEETVPSAGSSLSTCFLSSAPAAAARSKGNERDQSNPEKKKISRSTFLPQVRLGRLNLVNKCLVLRKQPMEELGPGGVPILQGRGKKNS